jgi:hypothetical protein
VADTAAIEQSVRPAESLLETDEITQAERIASLYGKNKKIIESLARSFNFVPVFVLQPNLFTKRNLSQYEKDSQYWKDVKSVAFQRKVYDLFRTAFAEDPRFVDLSDSINTTGTTYLDDHHTSREGNALIARELFTQICGVASHCSASPNIN